MLHQWLCWCLDSEDAAADQLLRILVELRTELANPKGVVPGEVEVLGNSYLSDNLQLHIISLKCF